MTIDQLILGQNYVLPTNKYSGFKNKEVNFISLPFKRSLNSFCALLKPAICQNLSVQNGLLTFFVQNSHISVTTAIEH